MNIYVIGMPGSGKSTVARLLSKALGRPLIDLDALIEKEAHMWINEIFERVGEDRFRQLETAALLSVKDGDHIISCGGGIVTRKENKALMTGFVICLDVDIETLRSRLDEGNPRPLLMKKSIETLHEERFLKYRDFADLMVANDEDPMVAVDTIRKALKERGI
ncbi:MAG: shikimate kinase [Acholeplasmataceae bacterium]|nr:shikimate kinase [Acholeplasmataceae bacterium]